MSTILIIMIFNIPIIVNTSILWYSPIMCIYHLCFSNLIKYIGNYEFLVLQFQLFSWHEQCLMQYLKDTQNPVSFPASVSRSRGTLLKVRGIWQGVACPKLQRSCWISPRDAISTPVTFCPQWRFFGTLRTPSKGPATNPPLMTCRWERNLMFWQHTSCVCPPCVSKQFSYDIRHFYMKKMVWIEVKPFRKWQSACWGFRRTPVSGHAVKVSKMAEVSKTAQITSSTFKMVVRLGPLLINISPLLPLTESL